MTQLSVISNPNDLGQSFLINFNLQVTLALVFHTESPWHAIYTCHKFIKISLIRTFKTALNKNNQFLRLLSWWTTNDIILLSDSEDDFRSGCRNLSKCNLKQSFSGLHSPEWFTILRTYDMTPRFKPFTVSFYSCTVLPPTSALAACFELFSIMQLAWILSRKFMLNFRW